jgi:hypothetical protein
VPNGRLGIRRTLLDGRFSFKRMLYGKFSRRYLFFRR